MSIRVVELSDWCDVTDSIRAQWNRLSVPSPMQSYEWLRGWWQTFGSESRRLKLLLALDRDDRVVGIAPCYIDSGWGQIATLRFLGDGLVCSDHATLILDPEHRPMVLAAIAGWLADRAGSEWDTIQWESIDDGDANIPTLVQLLNEYGCESSARETAGLWSTEIPSCWDEFLSILSKNHRKRCRRWYRDYFESGRAFIRVLDANQAMAGWDQLSRLNQERRINIGDRSAFLEARFNRFHADVLPNMMEQGKAELRILEVDGVAAACEYVLLDDHRMYCYQSGMRVDQNRDGYGNLSVLALFRTAIERGYRQVDFLRGDESYKQHWSAKRLRCFDHYVAANSLRGAIHATYCRSFDWMRVVRDSWVRL